MSDLSDLDLIGVLAAATAQGPGIGDDTALTATGTILAVDATGRRVRVRLRGGDIWLPANPARYRTGTPARILLNPTENRPILVLAPLAPREPLILGTVISGPTSGTITVNVEGATYTVPCLPGAYTVGATAWAGTDDWGVPVIVHAPSTLPAPDPVAPPVAPPTATVTATATIGPQQTGTYRAGSYNRWDVWGGSLGGGLATIYQGDAYGSGPLTGLACYGDQIVNLGAITIPKATLTVKRNRSGSGPAALTVQGSPHGTRPTGAPTATGTTATTDPVSLGGTTTLELPADIREALRTGTAKALAAVGAAYAGFGGTTMPGSFTLTIQYTRAA